MSSSSERGNSSLVGFGKSKKKKVKSSWRLGRKTTTLNESSEGPDNFTLRPSNSTSAGGSNNSSSFAHRRSSMDNTFSSHGSNEESVSYKSEKSSSHNRETEWTLYKETEGVLRYKLQNTENKNKTSDLVLDGVNSEESEIEEVFKPEVASSESSKGKENNLHDSPEQTAAEKKLQGENEKLIEQLSSLEKEKASLQAQVDDLKRSLEEAKCLNAEQADTFQRELDESIGQMEILRGERDGLKVKMKTLKETVSSMRMQIENLIASNAGGKVRLDNESENLNTQLKELRKDHEALKEQNSELSSQVASVTKVSAFWESRAAVLDEAKKQMEQEITNLQKERDVSIKEKLELAEKKYSHLQQEYKKDLELLKSDSTKAKKEEEHRREMEAEIQQKVETLRNVTQRLEELKVENKRLNERIVHLESTSCNISELKNLQMEFNNLKSEKDNLYNQLQSIEDERNKLRDRIAKINKGKISTASKSTGKVNSRSRKGSIEVEEEVSQDPNAIQRENFALIEFRLLQSQKENEKLRSELKSIKRLQQSQLIELEEAKRKSKIADESEKRIKQALEKAKKEFDQVKQKEVDELLASQKIVMENLVKAVRNEEELKWKAKSS